MPTMLTKEYVMVLFKAFELSGNKDTNTYQILVNVKKRHEEYLKERKMEMLHDDK